MVTGKAAALLVMLVVALSSGDAHTPPEEIVRRYCKLEVDGAGLTAGGIARQGELCVHPQQLIAPARMGRIPIVRGYLVRRDRIVGPQVWVDADYTQLGDVDDTLHFTRAEGARPNAPIRLRDTFHLVKDGSTWKIENGESRLRLGVDAAIRYVSQARDDARDATVRANAERTLNTLRQLAAGGPTQQTNARAETSAHAVLQTFCTLDAAGKQLTPAGWREIAALFIQPGSRTIGTVTVIKDFVVSNGAIADDGTAGVTAEYIQLLRLDTRTARLEQDAAAAGEIKIRRDFTLRLSPPRPGAPAVWTITGQVPEPAITVDTGIRFVTGLQQTTTDPVIKRNAARTLAGLRRQLSPSPH